MGRHARDGPSPGSRSAVSIVRVGAAIGGRAERGEGRPRRRPPRRSASGSRSRSPPTQTADALLEGREQERAPPRASERASSSARKAGLEQRRSRQRVCGRAAARRPRPPPARCPRRRSPRVDRMAHSVQAGHLDSRDQRVVEGLERAIRVSGETTGRGCRGRRHSGRRRKRPHHESTRARVVARPRSPSSKSPRARFGPPWRAA